MAKKRRVRKQGVQYEDWNHFQAEADYVESMFRIALGDPESSVAALERALKFKPDYAPAIMSMGSVEYQRDRRTEGRRLFLSLLTLPDNTPDLCEIVNQAGDFLIQTGAYSDGLELYRAAVEKFPHMPVLLQGLGTCASHERLFSEAIEAFQRALEIEPDKQEFVNDLGWTLFKAGKLAEARQILERAVSMNPSDKLARENLRICTVHISENKKWTGEA